MVQPEGPPAQLHAGGGGPASCPASSPPSSVEDPDDDPVAPELDPTEPLDDPFPFEPEEDPDFDPDEEPDFEPDEDPDDFDPAPEEEPAPGAPESSVREIGLELEQACSAVTAQPEATQTRNHPFRMLLSVVAR